MLTTKVAEAARKIRLADGPDYFDLLLSGIALDNIALIGIPGEPFMGVGKGLKETEGWDLVIPSCVYLCICSYEDLYTYRHTLM